MPGLDPTTQAAFNGLPPATQQMIAAAGDFDPQEMIHHWSPTKIVSSYIDPYGIRRLVVLFAVTSGVTDQDQSGVDIKVSNNGWELTLSEKWQTFMLDVESFYHCFPKDPRETEDEFTARRMAMMNTVRVLKANNQGAALRSIYRYKLPFQVDPAEMRITYATNGKGSRCVHIDLSERRRVQTNHFMLFKHQVKKSNGFDSPDAKFSSLTG